MLGSDVLVRPPPGPGGTLSLEAALELAVREAPLGVAIIDREFRFVMVNAAMARMNGRPVEAHLGQEVRTVVAEEVGVQGLFEVLREVLDTGEVLRDVILETGAGNCERRTLRCEYHPVTS